MELHWMSMSHAIVKQNTCLLSFFLSFLYAPLRMVYTLHGLKEKEEFLVVLRLCVIARMCT